MSNQIRSGRFLFIAGHTRALVLAAITALFASSAHADHADRASPRWTGAWSAATQAPLDAPPTFDHVTLREIVHVQLAGRGVRVRFSNAQGTAPLVIGAASVAIRATGAALRPGTLRTLTFGGARTISIAPGGVALTDPVALSVVQMAVGALAGWTIVIARGGFHTPWSQVPWAILLYLSVVATAVVIALQAWALARVSPVRASMIFATEPIFAALFAVAFFAERMSAREILGAAVILLGVAVTILWKPWMERREARRAARVAMGRS